MLLWGLLLEGRCYGNNKKSVIRIQPASGKGAGAFGVGVTILMWVSQEKPARATASEGLMITLQKHKSDFLLL